MKFRWFWIGLLLLLLCPLAALADVEFEGLSFPEDAEYIDLDEYVVKDFEVFADFLDRLPRLKQVDMWKNRITAEQCDFLASRFPDMKWGWTMVIKAWDHEHLVRTDYTSWSTLHNNKSAKHTSEDFSVLKYCWNLLALDVGHNNVTDLDFLYGLPKLRVLIVACNSVTDITPVASLKDLEYAELFNNRITDITPLKDLDHLLDLNLCFNRIGDLSPLLGLPNLQRLWLYSCQRTNTVPKGETVDAIRAAMPDTLVDTSHYSTAGTWRYTSGDTRHPHYAVIVSMFGENHLHPRTEYVPFRESWPLEGGERVASEPLELLAPQDFSDRNFLLPIDFSVGSRPVSSGYTDENTYTDSTISVTVGSGVYKKCDYWYADIILTDASQIRTMSAGMDGSFTDGGSEMDPIRLAQRSRAVLAINGDCWNSSEKRGLGYVIRQGILYEDRLEVARAQGARMMDILLIDEDGDFTVLHTPTDGTVPARVNGKRVLNAFTFGPILVENYEAVKDFQGADRWLDMAWQKPRQRMCICQVGHLHYRVVCCAGPFKENNGMTTREFAEFVATMDVKVAYNLDGGDSTLLYFNGTRVNEFGYKSQRKLMDIIYFASAEGAGR